MRRGSLLNPRWCRVAPKSDQEHYKIAFFFRKSVKGERRAKRKLVESADSLVLLDAPAMEAAGIQGW